MIRPRGGPRDPPSPTTLAHRLDGLERAPWAIRAVSAPCSPPDYVFDGMVSQHAESPPSRTDAGGASSLERAASESSRSSAESASDMSAESEPPKPVSPLAPRHTQRFPAALGGRPQDDGVREVIRGAYRLWKAVHAGAGTPQDFAGLVFDAIEGL
jgi:hypothetical protein